MAEAAATPLGLEVVEVVFRRQGKYTLLRVDLDRPGTAGVSLDDCERVSRDLETSVDRAALLEDRYELQVSSPGTDRPIRSDDDVRRNTGRRVVVEIAEPDGGERSLRGVLLGLAGSALRIGGAQGEETIVPRESVRRARQDVEQDLHAGAARPEGPGPRRKRRGIV